MDEFPNLEWTKSTETLEDILQNPRVKLPQLIRLSSQLEFLDSEIILQPNQILSVLAKQKISYVNAIDSRGKDVSIPLGCPYTVKQVTHQKECSFFETVEDIVKCDPLPKFVEVTKVGTLEILQKIVVGDVFKIVFVEKSEYTLDHVHFRNSVGTLIKVSVNDSISFQYATGYSTSVLLSTLLDCRHQEFPLYIQFTKQDKIPKKYLEFGMLTLPKNCVITTMDVVIASADLSSTEYVVVYPLGLGIKFEVNNKLKLANDKAYRELCSKYSCVSVEEAKCYLAEMIGFKENDHRVMMKYKKLKKAVRRSVRFINKESKEDNLNGFKAKDGESSLKINLRTDRKTDFKECDTKSKKKETNCNGKDKEKLKGDKETKLKKTEKEKKKKFVEKDKHEEDKNENIYIHQPPSLLSKVRSIKIRKDKSKTGELDPKNKMPIIENIYAQIDYEFLDKIQDEIAKSPSLPMKRESPPPIPGNHPCQNGGYASAVDSKKTGFYFDKASYSVIEISTWGIKEVGACLSTIRLTKYTTMFEENMVDGKILIDLDESVLTELGLNIFEARKLYKFVHGWRPGSTRPSSVYPPLKGFESDDPSDWDVEDTASHMLVIDPEVSHFCKENIVDGELLRDICVDTSIMEFLFPSSKLNIVKIKNYVIGGWRPKPSTGDENNSCTASSLMDASSGNDTLSNDAPMVAHMKKQFEQKSKYCGVGVCERADF